MKKICYLMPAFLLMALYGYTQTNTFPPDGNAGIGIMNPVPHFPGKAMVISGESQRAMIELWGENQGKSIFQSVNGDTYLGNLAMGNGKGDVHITYGNGADALFVAGSSGNVGIGTAIPQERLSVNGKAGISYENGGSTYVLSVQNSFDNLKFKIGTTTGGYLNIQGATINSGSPYNISLQANGGNVGIGTTTPQEKLSVNGNIRAKEIKVETTNWPDYVFKPDYQLPSLAETEKHILEKGHLPGIPSATDAEKNGISLSEMNAKLLQKIEELTLHLIAKDKELKEEKAMVQNIYDRLKLLEEKQEKQKK